MNKKDLKVAMAKILEGGEAYNTEHIELLRRAIELMPSSAAEQIEFALRHLSVLVSLRTTQIERKVEGEVLNERIIIASDKLQILIMDFNMVARAGDINIDKNLKRVIHMRQKFIPSYIDEVIICDRGLSLATHDTTDRWDDANCPKCLENKPK